MRDIYAVGEDKMLIVTSDRLSAFDVVLPDPIPDKGRVLNEIANFWFGASATSCRTTSPASIPRSVVRRRRARPGARPLGRGEEAEAAADRGGGARLHHRLGLEGLPARPARSAASSCRKGLQQAQKLPEPIFTPATKAETGTTTRTSPSSEVAKLIGEELAREGARHQHPPLQGGGRLRARRKASSSPTPSSNSAWTRRNELVLIDEVLTAGFLALLARGFVQGRRCRRLRYDKQFVRDYLETLDWNKSRRRRSCPPR